MDYSKDKCYAVKNNILKESDIFDFEGTPNETLYERLYRFSRENLDIQIERGNIPHGCFLYSTDFGINARAYLTNNKCYGIIINMGLMHSCIVNYLYNTKINDFFERKQPDLVHIMGSSLSYLIYQTNTLFTYYHELAHLFQFSKTNTINELQERSCANHKFNIVNHKLEINADTYAAICITTHICQYIDEKFENDINQDTVNFIIYLLGACLLDYLISFSNNVPLYYKDNSHPHSLIRMLNVMLNITYHLSSIPTFKEKEIKFDTIDLFRNILDSHDYLFERCGLKNAIQNRYDLQNLEMTNLLSYIEEVTFFDCSDYNDALDVWNRNV